MNKFIVRHWFYFALYYNGDLDKNRLQNKVYCDIRDTYYKISKGDYLSNLVEEERKRREQIEKKKKHVR